MLSDFSSRIFSRNMWHCLLWRWQLFFFFLALSLLLFCTETYNVEMRCHIVTAMALNRELFLDGRNWCTEEDTVLPGEVTWVAVLISLAPGASAAIHSRRRWCQFCKTTASIGCVNSLLLHMCCSIQSSLSTHLLCGQFTDCTAIASSRHPVNEKLYIMWSSECTDTVPEQWVPNHFVPSVLRTQTVGVPSRGSFHLIWWNRMEYVGQVKESDELLGMACVSFMSRKPNSNSEIFLKIAYLCRPFMGTIWFI